MRSQLYSRQEQYYWPLFSRHKRPASSPCIVLMSVVVLDGVIYTAPFVHVVFIGIKGMSSMMQTVVASPIELGASVDLSLQDILMRAAYERFNLSAEDAVESLGLAAGAMTLFKSTALTLAPQTKLTDLDALVVVTSSDESAAAPMKPLFLLAHVKVEKLARERARSAYKLYEALKIEASVEGITLSDTTFAAVCGLKCAAFSKAMARVSSVATPADGGLVSRLEKRIAAYCADLASLTRDLSEMNAARKVCNCRTHSLSLPTHSSPSTCQPPPLPHLCSA